MKGLIPRILNALSLDFPLLVSIIAPNVWIINMIMRKIMPEILKINITQILNDACDREVDPVFVMKALMVALCVCAFAVEESSPTPLCIKEQLISCIEYVYKKKKDGEFNIK